MNHRAEYDTGRTATASGGKGPRTRLRAFRLSIALLVLLAAAQLTFAAPPGEFEAASRYNRAGALYREGKFSEALDAYEALIAGGISNPDLYYNAAGAAYRSHRTGRAVLYLERALRLSPSDHDALANLEFINSHKQDKEPASGNAVAVFLARRYEGITVNTAAKWSGATFALMMLCATAALFVIGWKREILLGASALLFLAFAMSTGFLVQKVHHSAVTVEAVVMTPELNAYSGPGTENTHIFTVHEGTKLTLERSQDAWSLIRLKSGVGGWVAADSLGVI